MAKRRSAGEGTIYKLPSGNWRAQVSIAGRRISHTARSQQGARQWLRDVQGQIEQGLTYQADRVTLGEFMTGWLAQKQTRVRPATYQQYSAAWRSIQPALGRVKIKDLTPGMVQQLYDMLLTHDKRGARTVQIVHIVLHGCLSQAERVGLVARNPAEPCIVPRPEAEEMQVWDESQVSQFLTYVRDQPYEALYHLALKTGMRRNEMLGLQWDDVDWIKHTITVQRAVFQPIGGGWVFQSPKTKRGIRTVQVTEGMMVQLRAQMQQNETMRRLARKRWQEHGLIFPSLVGTPLGGTATSNRFLALVRSSGLPRIRLHDCRHTAASIMLSHGIPPVIVAGILGHSLAVLMQKYAHFITTTQGEAARLMEEITTPVAVELD